MENGDEPSELFCTIHSVRRLSKRADHWCLDCDDKLCSQCHDEYHCISRGTRHHEVVPIEDRPSPNRRKSNQDRQKTNQERQKSYQNDPIGKREKIIRSRTRSFKDSSNDHTDEHQDDTLVVERLEEIDVSHIERAIHESKINIEHIINDRKENLTRVQEQKQEFRKEVKQIRSKVISDLDKMEEELLKEFNEAEKMIKSRNDFLWKQLSQEKEKIEKLEKELIAFKKNPPELQLSEEIEPIVTGVNEVVGYLDTLSRDRSEQEVDIDINLNHDVVPTISTFGHVSIKDHSKSDKMKVRKVRNSAGGRISGRNTPGRQKTISQNLGRQAYNSIDSENEEIEEDEIKLTLHSTFNVGKSLLGNCVRSCITTPTGEMIFADSSNQRLVILNSNGSFQKEIYSDHSSRGPYDVINIDAKTVAVTFDKRIQIIDIESKTTTREITTKNCCYGIEYHKGALIWCQKYVGIRMLKLPDGTITTLVKENKLSDWSYLTSLGDKIYLSNPESETVTCYTDSGDQVWEFHDTAILDDPTCITVDNDANIYVTSRYTNCVVLLSPDGKHGRKILGRENNINKPWGIYLDKQRMKLLLVNQSGHAHLYKIS